MALAKLVANMQVTMALLALASTAKQLERNIIIFISNKPRQAMALLGYRFGSAIK